MTGFLLRWLAAFVLLALTFNSTELNYIRWATENGSSQLPLTILFGLLLFVGYVIYLRATFRSIGVFGILLVAGVFAALIWVLYDFGILALDNRGFNVWLGIIILSLVLGIGLSWSLVRRRLTGQADVDDVDE
ncbi:MAG: DUF6524 family protein [Pseudomonadota bacterium]